MGNQIERLGDEVLVLKDAIGGVFDSPVQSPRRSLASWSPGVRAVLLGCADCRSPLSSLNASLRKYLLVPVIQEAQAVELLLAVKSNDLNQIGLVCCFAREKLRCDLVRTEHWCRQLAVSAEWCWVLLAGRVGGVTLQLQEGTHPSGGAAPLCQGGS
jgi:hypothetical protein